MDIVNNMDQKKTTMLIREFAYNFMAVKPKRAVLLPYISTEKYKVKGNLLAYHYISRATVMSMMIEAAIYMGFKEIYLIGVDATTSSDKGGNFVANYLTPEIRAKLDVLKKRAIKDYDVNKRRKEIADRQRMVYGQLGKFAKKKGIKIFNATRGGELEAYPRVNFDEITKK